MTETGRRGEVHPTCTPHALTLDLTARGKTLFNATATDKPEDICTRYGSMVPLNANACSGVLAQNDHEKITSH